MAKLNLEEGQIVLCEVTKIMGTIVFVKIENYNLEGTITFAEIFPGKIRNIRDFVFPGKKIVCKVLRINPEVIELSLRRVKVNERNEFNDLYKKERNYLAMIRTILGEKSTQVLSSIKEGENNLIDFLENSKEKPELLEKYMQKEQAEKIISILKEKKSKETLLSRKFSLLSKAANGMVLVKNVIVQASNEINSENFEVSYIAAGKYFAKLKTKDPKQADQQLRKFIENMETFAKKNNCEFKEEKD
jgi:translation initiation factor 2 alpha subunit (eIF-2alpha)